MKESDRRPNKIWVDKGSEFYNNSFKKWLKDNNIEMHSIHNEGKLVVAERFISSTKLQTSVSFMKRRKPMTKILQRLSAGIDPSGIPKNIYDHSLKNKPNFILVVFLER